MSMIQAAHVGVGVYGREGGQAVKTNFLSINRNDLFIFLFFNFFLTKARASDYALRQFSHLRRLVTVCFTYFFKNNILFF